MDLLDVTMTYLENKIPDIPKMVMGKLGNGSCSSIRNTPSNVNTRNMNKEYTTDIAFQILIQDKSKLKGMNWINKVFKELEGLSGDDLVSPTDSFKLINLQCTTVPNFVDTNEQGESQWTALFSAEIQF